MWGGGVSARGAVSTRVSCGPIEGGGGGVGGTAGVAGCSGRRRVLREWGASARWGRPRGRCRARGDERRQHDERDDATTELALSVLGHRAYRVGYDEGGLGAGADGRAAVPADPVVVAVEA